jgi:hypothetical protein
MTGNAVYYSNGELEAKTLTTGFTIRDSLCEGRYERGRNLEISLKESIDEMICLGYHE